MKESIIRSFNEMPFLDFIWKCIYKIHAIFSWKIMRKIRVLLYFKTLKIRIGKNVSLIGNCRHLKLGHDINIYNNCVIELSTDAKLEIGNCVIASFGCVLSVNKSLKIGNYVQLGEYTSIRDTTHDYRDDSKPMMKNKDISDSIVIGNDVWIGRNCLISPGTYIEDGVVVGANSLVKGRLEKNCIYAGNPLRVIKSRFNKTCSQETKDN